MPTHKTGYSIPKVAGVKRYLMQKVKHMSPHERPAPAGYRWVYCKCFRHWRTKKIVYPKKGDCFMFLVRCK